MFRTIAKVAALSLFALAASPSLAAAADALFVLQSKDGKTTLEVTDTLIAKVGTHSYKAILPSSDGKEVTVGGPYLRDLLKEAHLSGKQVNVRALDNYEMAVPAEDYAKYDLMVATQINGAKLSIRDKGPAWLVYPTVDHPETQSDVYQSRSVWQIKDIVVE